MNDIIITLQGYVDAHFITGFIMGSSVMIWHSAYIIYKQEKEIKDEKI